MMEFVDYDFYAERFYGNKIQEREFPNAALRASIFIKYITFGRVSDSFESDYPQYEEDIKMAVCAVAEAIYDGMGTSKTSEGEDGREKRSESVGKLSVSYVTESMDGEIREKTLERKQYAAAYPYLIHTGLMYRGCG